MIIKFYPAMMAMIEQSEVIEIKDNKLFFNRQFGPNFDFQEFELKKEIIEMVNTLSVNENLENYNDMIEVIINEESTRFTVDQASLSYQTLANLLTTTLDFKYNPRALITKHVLFYLGDYDKHFTHHFYQEAIDLINKLNLEINDNKVIINDEVVEITIEKYKVISFNTNNELYQVVISTLKYKELFE